ncbi:MAG: RIP metalloprotease RseP [Flavobacteriia bacterium]|jgi:regulator of sigma E protease
MDFWIKAAQLILALSILVILHEFGHFIPARLFKTRVEKFYLFFNPWFSLFKKKVGDTEWGIGWLPLGGYVKISGMVDESMDKEQMAQPAQPWEFRSKPAWQRLIIMIGGVTVNLLLGIFIYICIMFVYGEEQIQTKDLKAGLAIHPYLAKYDLHSGDNILKVEGAEVNHFNDINTDILLNEARKLTVQRPDGKIEEITLPAGVEYKLFKEGAFPATGLRHKSTLVDTVMPKTPAMKAGLQKGDRILSINGTAIEFYDQIQSSLYEVKGKKATIVIQRSGKIDTLESKVLPAGTIGFAVKKEKYFDLKAIHTVKYSFGESIGRGTERGFSTLSNYVSQMKFVFTKKGASSIGGFGAIGNLFPPTWDWQIFWMNTALLSIILAFMNILPIPALDGGHIVFLLYEMITGREAPQKVLEYAQYVGFILLMGLLLYANGNDLYRYFTGG